jgi:MOSC domain-containing protein YiiM
MNPTGRIVQVSVSSGGVPKRAVAAAKVGRLGLEGDAHRDPAQHGGPERAVCLWAFETIEALRAEGHAIAPGAIGANVTVAGLDWAAVRPGCRVLLGDRVLLEITRYTSPCVKITRAFKDGGYSRVSQKRHPGSSRVYARVLAAGTIRAGDAVRLVDEIEAAEVLATARG